MVTSPIPQGAPPALGWPSEGVIRGIPHPHPGTHRNPTHLILKCACMRVRRGGEEERGRRGGGEGQEGEGKEGRGRSGEADEQKCACRGSTGITN